MAADTAHAAAVDYVAALDDAELGKFLREALAGAAGHTDTASRSTRQALADHFFGGSQ